METKDPLKKLDRLAKSSIANDPKLLNLLINYFSDIYEVKIFVKKCLKKLKTRRMLLRVKWYIELASLIRRSRDKRPALPLIFLMAMAESIARSILPNKKAKTSQSFDIVKLLFNKIDQRDKVILKQKIRRANLKPNINSLRFSSILKLLWNARNDAVHGIDFWSFGLPDSETGLLTHGLLGTKKHRRKISLEINIQYENLQKTAKVNCGLFYLDEILLLHFSL